MKKLISFLKSVGEMYADLFKMFTKGDGVIFAVLLAIFTLAVIYIMFAHIFEPEFIDAPSMWGSVTALAVFVTVFAYINRKG